MIKLYFDDHTSEYLFYSDIEQIIENKKGSTKFIRSLKEQYEEKKC